ncbi:hypothetical protein SKAU_G00074830 [Synaphobranchus kaupii]|uniref:Uncharacterized protein n=1 Tax=Synaphobranchus kaupii TaxID=118154 RepID=A0A9Q1G8F2_SYNKA|nr:hypothetical protein SKAU_G00074830 [Synaphobranchus kaupii]
MQLVQSTVTKGETSAVRQRSPSPFGNEGHCLALWRPSPAAEDSERSIVGRGTGSDAAVRVRGQVSDGPRSRLVSFPHSTCFIVTPRAGRVVLGAEEFSIARSAADKQPLQEGKRSTTN